MINQRSRVLFYLVLSIVFSIVSIFLISRNNLLLPLSRGNDFVVQWFAVRTFAKENLSPYLPVVQATTEDFFYGNQARIGEKGLKFSSPLYSVVAILPFALINHFQTAQFAWTIFLCLALIVNTWFALRLTGWNPSLWLLFLIVVLTLLGFHNFQALASGSVIILACLLLFSSLLAIRSHRYELAGVLLALATIQPRAILLAVLFVLVWSISKRYWAILVWFLAGVAILFIIGLLFIPDWPIQYLKVIVNFKDFFPINTPVNIFSSELPGMGRQLGWGLSLVVLGTLLFEWIEVRKKNFNWFLWTFSLTLVGSQWIGIPAEPNDFVLLILPLLLVLSVWDQRFKHFGKWMAGFSLVFVLTGLWGLFALNYSELSQIQLNRIFLFPFPLFLFVGLYWVKWWAIRPQMDFIDDIKVVDRY